MKTAEYSLQLQDLAQLLDQSLNTELFLLLPIQVRCLVNKGRLIVLLQHPHPHIPNPQRIFQLVEEILVATNVRSYPKALLFLRVYKQPKPYAFQKLYLQEEERGKREEELTKTVLEESFKQDYREEEEGPPQQTVALNLVIPEEQLIQTETIETIQPIATEEALVVNEPENNRRKPWLLIVAGLSVGTVCFFGTLYFLTRPCGVGECRAIPDAKQLVEESLATLKEPQSGQTILLAQKQINQSIKTLQNVPPWSSHYQSAQKLIQPYQIYARDLELLIQAMTIAHQAVNQSNSQAFSVTEWTEIGKLWEDAIAVLKKQPETSSLYELTELKIYEYQINLSVIKQRLSQEKKAQKALVAGKEAAQLAQVRQGVAQSASNWQQVYTTWKTAVDQLKQISEQTTVYEEAQALLKAYLPQLQTAQNRQNQEKVGFQAYNQGINLAQLAQSSESQERWTDAVVSWQKALTQVKQIPQNTLHYHQSQDLINNYQQSLNRAETKLKIVQKAQGIQKDLEQICLSTQKICDYTITTKLIKIYLTPDYLQQIRQSSVNAQFQQDESTQLALQKHVSGLQNAFKAISKYSGIPVAIYISDGTLVETHTPD